MSHKSSLFGGRATAYRKAGGGAGNDNNKDAEAQLQRENEAIMDALASDASKIKQAARDLNQEVDEHNKLLDGLATTFDSAKDGVRKSMTKINTVMEKNGCKATFVWAVGIFLVVIMFYYLGKQLFGTKKKE